tara:strand:- start:1 stop:111 length:111 start_codon:yes stop_codon:yes gene_type:complete
MAGSPVMELNLENSNVKKVSTRGHKTQPKAQKVKEI